MGTCLNCGGESYPGIELCDQCQASAQAAAQPDARARLDAALDRFEVIVEEWVKAEGTPDEFASDDKHDAARAAVLAAVEEIAVEALCQEFERYYGVQPPPEMRATYVERACRLVRGKDEGG